MFVHCVYTVLLRQMPVLRSWCMISVVGCAGLFGGGNAAGKGGAKVRWGGEAIGVGWARGRALEKGVEARKQRANNWNSSEVCLKRGSPLRGALPVGPSQMPNAVAPSATAKKLRCWTKRLALYIMFGYAYCARGLVV